MDRAAPAVLADNRLDLSGIELSPFVFSKAKSASKGFSDKQIDGILFDLVSMYHDAHRGEKDLWMEMERWGLRI